MSRARSGPQGKVESCVWHAKKTPLKGMRFESLEEAQAYLDRWGERWADTRIHGTTKRQVSAMFAEERPALLPLPLEPFRYYQYGERTVHLDAASKSKLPTTARHLAGSAAASMCNGTITMYGWSIRTRDKLLREHLRQQRGRHRIQEADRPHRTPLKTEQLLLRADLTGLHIGALCRAMHDAEGQLAVRRILGVAALSKKYGVGSTDEACAIALEAGVCSYRFVRRYLERNPQLPLSLRQVDPLIRQLTHYRELIEKRTRQKDDSCTL